MPNVKVLVFFLLFIFGVACGFFINWLVYGEITHGANLAASVSICTMLAMCISLPIMDGIGK